MSVLVTGGSGFIGKSLIPLLSEHAVTVLSRTQPKDQSNINWVNFDLEELLLGKSFPGEYKTVIHLAARAHILRDTSLNPKREFTRFNNDITIELARFMAQRNMTRFIFVSSIGVNGGFTREGEKFSKSSIPKPITEYGKSKCQAELSLTALSKELGFDLVIIRPVLVYGKDAPGNFGMLTKLVKSMPILPFGLANNRKDFISVQNLSSLLVTCIDHPKAPGNVFLASDGESVSTKHFTNAIAQGLGKKVIQLPIPVVLMRAFGRLMGKESMIDQLYGNLEVDSSNTEEVLGWEPPLTMRQAMLTLREKEQKINDTDN
ncbi:NAD-dependent epimerase/dehydratase family protein [Vibrio owensii]|uniref:NAD-dependent epimerase/dehydratase family protein n=1 Tax=Vibrio owensii TaxID=696485 RepID=UPI000EFA47AF|nr:NAD-dependent epimerase/dehydratase family protein [Vibrio owensii]AYO21198.1 NAD-dependent epimerase/dehydratase family protein [Vibrio owensii]